MTDICRLTTDGRAIFHCPGCGFAHAPIVAGPADKNWGFNWNQESPTFTPSILVRWTHPKGHTNENPAPVDWEGEMVEEICHSFVTDGKIQFLADCTHALKGQTVDLPPWDTRYESSSAS